MEARPNLQARLVASASDRLTKKATLLIVDDHVAIREGIKSAFHGSTEFAVIGEATDATQALALVREKEPSIVILDVSLPDGNGIDTAADIIRAAAAPPRIVVYTMHEEQGLLASMAKAGVAACVLKGEPFDNLVSALRTVRDGGRRFPSSLSGAGSHTSETAAHRSSGFDAYPQLSRREKEVLLMLAGGRTVKEAAFDLGLSPKTVETYKYRLMRKLRVDSIVELAKLAIRSHLVEP